MSAFDRLGHFIQQARAQCKIDAAATRARETLFSSTVFLFASNSVLRIAALHRLLHNRVWRAGQYAAIND